MTDSVGFETYYEGTFVPLKVWNIRSKVALRYNENLDSDWFTYVSRVKPLNYH